MAATKKFSRAPAISRDRSLHGLSHKRIAVTVANDKMTLIRAAAQARGASLARYSGFKVGAALLTKGGKVVTGANVESASYGLTCCAERVALFKALTDGYQEFVAIAIVAGVRGGPMPCGACRQLLAEYAPRAKIWIADIRALRRVRSYTVRELLPGAFVDFPG